MRLFRAFPAGELVYVTEIRRASLELTSHYHVHRGMVDQPGIEELEAWLYSLVPRAELVARMALRLRYRELGCRQYFARIAWLIKELDLSPEDLNGVRADAQKVAASLDDVSVDRETA